MDVQLKVGDKIVVKHGDGDGAENLSGFVVNVYRSGRCCVELADGSIRNLSPEMLEKIE